MGIQIRPNTTIGTVLLIDNLFRDGYASVFIGTGAEKPRCLGIQGESLGNVHFGLNYLANPTAHHLGERVAVIGMGNAAMDVARTALRNGSRRVMLFSRDNTIAASSNEVDYARLDGAEFVFGKQIHHITEEGPVFQSAILRFAKYKGPEIGRIEAHDERTKEKYASNPDVDTGRSRLNFHLVKPRRSYRAEAEKQIAEAGCKARKDSVRVVETLITASPEFFLGKKPREVKEFFEYAVEFIQSRQSPETIISAVVHMDEKTPHMHLCFVPLTPDGRLSAKDIIGNRKKLTQWQDDFWKHMVKKYPDFERGESASETGRTHIPPRIFKEAVRLNWQKDKIARLLSEITPLNAKKKSAEIETILTDYIPSVEKLMTRMKKAGNTVKELKKEIAALEQELDGSKASVQRQLELSRKVQELDDLRHTVEELQQALDAIPPEILSEYHNPKSERKETIALE